MKRYAESLFVVTWVALVLLFIQISRHAPCPDTHHEPRISLSLTAQTR